jgi:hypothetical protein
MADNPLYAPGSELLLARGYEREGRAQTYVREVAPGITGKVWINAGTGARLLNLSPKVGLRHEELTRRVVELAGLTAPPLSTLMTSLYALHPTKRPADASIVVRGEDERNAAVWAWVASQLDEYGEPWLEEHAEQQRMAESLRNLEAGAFSRVTLPVLLWLGGDGDAAREALEWGRSLDVSGGPTVDYDAFAARLLAEIDARPSGA